MYLWNAKGRRKKPRRRCARYKAKLKAKNRRRRARLQK